MMSARRNSSEVSAMDVGEVHELLPHDAEPLPLRVEELGVVRLGTGRISLDLVVEQYENGMTPEDMVRVYDTLVLADVHAAIAFYLRHTAAVRTYLKRRRDEREALRAKEGAERRRGGREAILAGRSGDNDCRLSPGSQRI